MAMTDGYEKVTPKDDLTKSAPGTEPKGNSDAGKPGPDWAKSSR